MINNIEITKSVNSLRDKEEHIVKTINVLEEKGYVVNRSKVIKLSIIQMLKHCYDNIAMLNDNHINNISNITFNI